MTDFRRVLPLIITIALAMSASSLLLRADAAAGAAGMRESRGMTRGPFLDRLGRPLVLTESRGALVRRVVTAPDLAAVVGYRDPSGAWHGLEMRYNAQLEALRARRDWRTFFLHLRGQTTASARVRLTIDRTLQRVADAALGRASGAVVALDPRSGAVLALVSKPSCAPELLGQPAGYASCSRAPSHPLLDRATQLRVPPGSSFKIVTLTAAIDTRRFSLDSVFSGADVFGPSPYFDNQAYPSNITRSDLTELTLMQALAFSDNFTFAHIGLTLGAATLLRYAHRYYLGRHIPFDYPVAPSVVAAGNPSPTTAQLAQSSFGAEVDRVTPLQMALIAATVANGGLMMAPHLVQDVESSRGRVLWRYRLHALGRVMSRQAAHDVATAMIFVVDHGSGFKAQIPGVQVAGKTGTAASGGDKPHAWFIAFAPARHPVVAVAVLREYSGEGFEYAAPIAHRVLAAALAERGRS